MTEIVLFHMLAATAGAALGLLAIWAGLGRLHWPLRFIPIAAVIVSMFPVPAFDLALVFVSQALVVTVPLLLVRRFRLPPADAIATPPASQPWRRFSVADLFRATLLIAAVFGVVAYLPGDIRESWWKYVLLGTGFGMATLAGTWAALAHRPWWIRLGVVFLIAPLAGVPTALDETIYADFRVSTWPWSAVTAAVGVLVAVWLLLAQAAGYTVLCFTDFGVAQQPTSTQSDGVVRSRLKSIGLGLVSLAILPLPAVAYYNMIHPAPIPPGPLPVPNAYDDLLRIATSLQNIGTPDGSLAIEEQDSAVQYRRVLFDELHAALQRTGAVPLGYESTDLNMDQNSALQQLARAVSAEGDRWAVAGNTIDAQRSYLDLVELAFASSRGGLLIHRVLGAGIEAMGIEGLARLRVMFSPEQRRTLIVTLKAFEKRWEPAAAVDARELAWQHRSQGWPARISFINPPAMSQLPEAVDHRHLAMLRLLACELALVQFAEDNVAPSKDLAGLVPQYLSEVPDDPFSGRPPVYQTDSTGYVLYSIGLNGTDDGGRRGESLYDGDLFLDPAPPPASDGAGDD